LEAMVGWSKELWATNTCCSWLAGSGMHKVVEVLHVKKVVVSMAAARVGLWPCIETTLTLQR
jgi:hypothetical protein